MIPNTWPALAARLMADGWSDGRLADARVAWELGYHAALHQLGQTTTAKSMVKAWHEHYGPAKADARDALKRSKRGSP